MSFSIINWLNVVLDHCWITYKYDNINENIKDGSECCHLDYPICKLKAFNNPICKQAFNLISFLVYSIVVSSFCFCAN